MIDVAKRLVSANISRFTPTGLWRFVADKRVPRFCYQYQPFNSLSYYRFTIEDLVDRIQSKFYSSPFQNKRKKKKKKKKRTFSFFLKIEVKFHHYFLFPFFLNFVFSISRKKQ